MSGDRWYVKQNSWKVYHCGDPGIMMECQAISTLSFLLKGHNQYLNGDVWNQPYENQIGTLQHFSRLSNKFMSFSHLNYKFHFSDPNEDKSLIYKLRVLPC